MRLTSFAAQLLLILERSNADYLGDESVLKRLFDVADGLRWTNQTNWMTGESVCTWFGITCDDSDHVTEISLSNNNLVGRLPKHMYRMEYLTKVNVKDNSLRDADFIGFAEAKDADGESKLEIFDIAGNALTSLTGIGDAPTTLRELHLTENMLQGPMPTELFKLSMINVMYLSYNQFTGTLPTEVGQLKFVERFYLYGNDLTGTIPSEIGLLKKAEIFTLAENRFGGSLPSHVSEMINLKTFSAHNHELKKGKLTGSLPSFHKSPFLSELKLDGNAIEGSIPTDFMHSSNVTSSLVTIGLSSNLLTGSLPTSLLKFSSLVLDVTGNQISDVDPLFCQQGAWMSGLVEEFGCDALLCPKKTWSIEGRDTEKSDCTECDSAQFFGSTECASAPVLPTPDWLALAKLYQATNGEHWNISTGWEVLDDVFDTTDWEETNATSFFVCTWHGVDCSNGKVQGVNLKNNGLVGTLPTEIFNLEGLKELDLSLNTIELDAVLGLSAIANAKDLLQINLSGTKISTIAGISEAPALTSVYLDSLELPAGPFPTELLALTGLHLLHMQFSGLTGYLPTEIGALNKLKTLFIYNNDLTGSLPSELGLLTDLTSLELSENSFSGELPTHLDGMTSLKVLHIQQSKDPALSGNLPAFTNYPNLQQLNLDNNAFTGSIPKKFLQGIQDKSKPVFVSLAHNQLDGTVPSELDDFTELDIRLEGNKISGIATELCDNSEWMNGKVGELGDDCDAILCPPKSYNVYGKLGSGRYGKCEVCDSAEFFGSVQCEGEVNLEKTILDTLFQATGGTHWTRSDNWTEAGVPICYREGIICTGGDLDAGVTEIELSANNLNGDIPGKIFDLPKIKLLSFADNQVDLSFEKIGDAETLVVLKLSNTNLRSLAGIGGASSALRELHVAGNQLNGTIPPELYDLSNLQYLFMGNNLLSGTIASEIGQMVALKELSLSNNMLTGQLPSDIGSLSSLSRLALNLNSLSGNLPLTFNNLTALTTLLLEEQEDRKFSGSLISFSSNTALETISLNDNDFSGTIPSDFLALVSLDAQVRVYLQRNRIGGTVPSSLNRLSDFFIDLADNEIVRIKDVCQNPGWMDGNVSNYGCDAILCEPGTFSGEGKQISPSTKCTSCPGLTDAPFFGATDCTSHKQGNATERDILIELYDNLNGTNWADQTNWNSDEDHCTWFGIVCDGDHVSEINLEFNGLVAISDVSTLVFGLANLVKLDLKGNEIPLDLTEIPSSSKLRILMLSSTGLQSLDGIANANDLRRLHLTDNALSGTFPEELFMLTELRTLYLSFNAFTGTIPDRISKFTSLEEFYAYGNKFNGTLPGESISNLSNLQVFVVANNFLGGEIPSAFNNMPKLEQLSLYDQQSASLFTGTVPNFLNSPRLWYFDASNNDLTGSIPSDFMQNSDYRNESVTIYLSNNEITGTLPIELQAFSDLDIMIVGNRVSGLQEVFCEKKAWMQQQVASMGCAAIACPPFTYLASGRQKSVELPCQSCSNPIGNSFFGATSCGDISVERDSLLEIYRDTGGSSWNSSEKWTTSEPICSWEGVSCDDGNFDDVSGITGLTFESNNLIGTMPMAVWKLPFLRVLNVKSNTGLHVNFNGLSSAKNLEVMYLSEVRIDSIFGVSKAQKLKEIHFTGCGISGPFPTELVSLSNTLEGIYIAYNSFTGTLPTELGDLLMLNSFYAFDNEFSGPIPSQIGLVSENLISGAIPTEVSILASLQLFSAYRLDKPGPSLSGPLPSFNQNPQLTDLYLYGNTLTGEIPSDFLEASTNAHNVNLGYNALEGEVPASLGALDTLSLELAGNMISGFPTSFCNKTQWMDGAIASAGCNGFLCPTGYVSPIGRANASVSCTKCPEKGAAKYFGGTTCSRPVDQRPTLVSLFQMCGGTTWNHAGGWATHAPMCDWYGIECEDNSVVGIRLGSNNLVGTPPSEIFDLPDLRTIEFFSNPIQFKFANIKSAKRLTTIRLDSTGLANVSGISEAPAVAFIDLRFNELKGTLHKDLFRLKYLRYLNLGNNKLSGTLPASFSELKYLKALRLGNNRFVGRLPTFQSNPALTTIDLSDNELTGTIPRNFLERHTSSTPVVLDLSGNQLTGWVPAELDRFKELKIYLRNNMISDIPVPLCDNVDWNEGDVEAFGCNGLLCPPGTYNLVGRERPDEPCQGCLDGSPYFGQVTCTNPSSSRILSVSLVVIASTILAAIAL
ncbi:hypothetical protein MHU86_6373 [Fragilaria crotonensis]|nr:hypothetical protein MHU86_6373 [Fragilaria crotonensis]